MSGDEYDPCAICQTLRQPLANGESAREGWRGSKVTPEPWLPFENRDVKLLIYSHYFAPSVGGVETIVLSLARGLAGIRKSEGASEFDITLVTQTPADHFDDRSLPFFVIRRPTLVHLWRLIRRSNILHLAGPALTPLFLAWLAGKPVVVEHHGYQAICPNGILVYQPDGTICPGHFQARRYQKCLRCEKRRLSGFRSVLSLLLMFPRLWFTRRAARNLAITRHVLERHKLPRSQVAYYGIEDPLFRGIPTVSGLDKGAARAIFAFVGRFVPEKGIPVLLQATRQLLSEGYAFELRLVGDGPERAKLEQIIRNNHLEKHTTITGFLAGPALADALKDVDAVVMPSVWEETAGLAAIEQMMRGRLVIASDVGGLGEIVGDAGWRCPPGDVQALADCMRRVLQNASIIQAISSKTREQALHRFSLERMVAEHATAYRGVFLQTKT